MYEDKRRERALFSVTCQEPRPDARSTEFIPFKTSNIHLFDAISSSTASITLPKPPWGAGEPAAGARQGAVISLRARPGSCPLMPDGLRTAVARRLSIPT